MNINDLRGKRSALATECKALLDNSEKTNEWTAASQEAYDAKLAEIDNIDKQISNIESYLKRAAENADAGDDSGLRDAATKTPGKISDESKAIKAMLLGGLSNLEANQLAAMRARQTGDIRNAMSTNVGTEGGYTVAELWQQTLVEALKAYGGIFEEVTTMMTETGATMNFPTTNATAEEGEIVGQNASVGSPVSTTFGNTSIEVFKYSSKPIAIPFELLQDSMFDMELYIQNLLAMRLGRITAKHFTTGTGTGQPLGIVTAASSGAIGATGASTTITYEKLVDLEHSVDPLYRARPGACFAMNDNTLRAIRQIKDGVGRPIFVPGYEAGNPGGAPDRILNRPICIVQEMADMAANAKSILFGDLSSYIRRIVMDLTLFRMADSNYIHNGQIGFIAFNRQGGGLVDVGGAVKYYQNSAS